MFSTAKKTIALILLCTPLIAFGAKGEWYISGIVTKVNKNSIVLTMDKIKTELLVPKQLLKDKDLKVGAVVQRNVTEAEIVQIAKVKGGGGSR
ncbi:MAG: hypothetical protein COV57_03140 [Candidatus Liptonbacteria bacterium CG11_big_fil_rev_8_21_14_0_20_35_14]|uniref:Uncharacterized protein n=1 Tax=Candidatus Liptonbacteria bacterium CG11_big_fil_rev_8_21_14_0_20_35_14 TaxID=1974634 RepID=A0A2H0N728_9BACT|nr:MAG: hypothetical protein COV57_03140 [Candidatus Liptonbacteria bacterium CG11_big_fil_rev_8_21_14_0_20_35_14]PJB52573.1 MAG: hypothetical protein CO099_11965 [Bdellovibrio sp. CG_4_9_14_3_um_filter_39_7]